MSSPLKTLSLFPTATILWILFCRVICVKHYAPDYAQDAVHHAILPREFCIRTSTHNHSNSKLSCHLAGPLTSHWLPAHLNLLLVMKPHLKSFFYFFSNTTKNPNLYQPYKAWSLFEGTICSRTIWSWTTNNLKVFSEFTMLQDHIWNTHCSRSMFTFCSWSSMLFKYGPGAYLT